MINLAQALCKIAWSKAKNSVSYLSGRFSFYRTENRESCDPANRVAILIFQW